MAGVSVCDDDTVGNSSGGDNACVTSEDCSFFSGEFLLGVNPVTLGDNCPVLNGDVIRVLLGELSSDFGDNCSEVFSGDNILDVTLGDICLVLGDNTIFLPLGDATIEGDFTSGSSTDRGSILCGDDILVILFVGQVSVSSAGPFIIHYALSCC